MWVSIGLLRSATGSMTIPALQFSISHHIPHFSTPLRSCFQPGGGRCMIANPMNVWPFSKPWRKPVVTSQQSPVRGGCVMSEDIYHAVLPRRISPLLLMKICGQTKTTDMTDFVFTMDYFFLDLWFSILTVSYFFYHTIDLKYSTVVQIGLFFFPCIC